MKSGEFLLGCGLVAAALVFSSLFLGSRLSSDNGRYQPGIGDPKPPAVLPVIDTQTGEFHYSVLPKEGK